MTWANRERGTDSAGFFDSTGRMTKRAGDPADVLRADKVQKWLRVSQEHGWFIAGHTRYATRGAVNRRNSHPFRYGRIIGSHNGMVSAPSKFKVDSEYLFWLLNKHPGKYNEALKDVGGYFGLSWFDGTDFYLLCQHGELAVCEVDGVYYYSSSWKHLDSCTGVSSTVLKDGEVWQFNASGLVGRSRDKDSGVAPFVSTSAGWSHYYDSQTDWSSTYASYSDAKSARTRNHASGGRGGPGKKASENWWQDENVDPADGSIQDYDREWSDAWTSYCSENCDNDDGGIDATKPIHSLPDDEFAELYAG